MSICIGGKVLIDWIECCGENMKQDGDRFYCEVCGDVVSGTTGEKIFNMKDTSRKRTESNE